VAILFNLVKDWALTTVEFITFVVAVDGAIAAELARDAAVRTQTLEL